MPEVAGRVELWAAFITTGVLNGGLYALLAVGISLIFGMTGIPNFAHGQIVMVFAYVAFALTVTASVPGFVLMLLMALGGGLAVGAILERGLFRWTVARPINGFVVSLGLVMISESLAAIQWGTDPRVLPDPLLGASLQLPFIHLPAVRALTLVIALAVCMTFFAFLKYTRVGTALRCCTIDREAAALMGINVAGMQTLTFAVGSAIAAIAGILIGTSYPFTPFSGSSLIVVAFLISLVGGLGNLAGAFVLALGYGMVEAVAVGLGLGEWTLAITFVFLLLVLWLRPTGLFRGNEASSVG